VFHGDYLHWYGQLKTNEKHEKETTKQTTVGKKKMQNTRNTLN